MAKKTININQLSSQELYELAEKKRREEQKKMKEQNREKLKALRAKRRKLIAEHQKELDKIDMEIARLSGRRIKRKKSISRAVLDIINAADQISTSELKAELAKQGLVSKNLLQTLAYLKRQGKIISPARAIYQAAPKK